MKEKKEFEKFSKWINGKKGCMKNLQMKQNQLIRKLGRMRVPVTLPQLAVVHRFKDLITEQRLEH